MIKVLDPFFRFHPGADIAESLFAERDSWIRQIVKSPHAAIELLSEKYKFGDKTDFWDDYVFLLVISPALAQICALPQLRTAINKYSELDHSLFFLIKSQTRLRIGSGLIQIVWVVEYYNVSFWIFYMVYILILGQLCGDLNIRH